MTFTYHNFRAAIKATGLATQNRFWVGFAPPKVLAGESAESVLLYCKSASVPGVNISSSPERLTGEVREIPYDRNFGAASLTFWNRADFDTRDYFERWVNGIQNPETREIAYFDDYRTDVKITVLDKMDKPRYEIMLRDAHPKNIGVLSLDNETPGIMSFDVSFDYQRYVMKKL